MKEIIGSRKDCNAVSKPSSEQQFYKYNYVDYLCFVKKTRAIALALLSLMISRLADKIVVFILKNINYIYVASYWTIYSTFHRV